MDRKTIPRLPLRRLGKTGLDVPVVGFGGLVLRDIDEGEAFKLISYAIKKGIRFFDAARHYLNSESYIGMAQKRLGKEHFIFSSKTMARSYTSAHTDLHESLRLLQIPRVDIFGFHHVQTLEEYREIIGAQGALKAFKEAKEQGLLSHIMLSSHSRDVLLQAVENEDIEILMFPFNFLDETIFGPILKLANIYEKGTIAIKVLAGGNIRHVKEGIQIALIQPFSFVLTGARTVEQLDRFIDHAIASSNLDITTIDTTRIEKDSRRLDDTDIPACRHCGYCHSYCPQEIPISTIFEWVKMVKLYRSGHKAKDDYNLLKIKANQCIRCKKCLPICPEKVNIPAFLKKAHSILSKPVTEKERWYHGERAKS